MMVSVTGCIPPAPMPCSARAAMSHPMLPAAPHAKDPRRKSATLASATGLRPTVSASLP
jgi:hypothetical protein